MSVVIERIPVEVPFINANLYPHLRGIPLPPKGVRVEILIGQDNSEAFIPLEVRKGKPGEPYAVKTILGWAMNGKVEDVQGKTSVSLFNKVMATPKVTQGEIKVSTVKADECVNESHPYKATNVKVECVKVSNKVVGDRSSKTTFKVNECDKFEGSTDKVTRNSSDVMRLYVPPHRRSRQLLHVS